MDFSRFKTNDWLVVGGGALMLIAGFLPWYTAKASGSGVSRSESRNAFDYFALGTIPWILLVGAAVIVVLLVGGLVKANVPPMAILAITGVATILVLLRTIISEGGPSAADQASAAAAGISVGVSRSIGLWLALIAGIVSTAGAFLGFQAAGGNIRDFTDPDKLKGAVRDIDRG